MLYLAMTAAEIAANPTLPQQLGYMACLFSPYGTGLSNLPKTLPEGSLLILADRTPVMGHDAAVICSQLSQVIAHFHCKGLILDFQREGEADTAKITEAIVQTASCPVAAAAAYAASLDCPVFLPPLPLTQTPEEYTVPWQGREIWMEAALDAIRITVTAEGSRYCPCPPPEAPLPYYDAELFCHYGLELAADAAVFTLHRTWEDLLLLMEHPAIHGWVGLYQELKDTAIK